MSRVTYQWGTGTRPVRAATQRTAEVRRRELLAEQVRRAEQAAELLRWAGPAGVRDLAAHGDIPAEVVSAVTYARQMGIA